MESYRNVTAEQLLHRTRIPIEVLDTADDLAWDMARVMLETVRRNNAAARQTVLIVPVGPVGQYRRFARLANLEKLDLSGLVLINMDEYLDENGRWICQDDPLSFRGFMQREFYDLLQGRSVVPPQNRIFPDPDAPQRVQEKIDALGGVDIAFGGVGIMGHIAFNEALPEGETMTNEAFAALDTRVLELTEHTRTINAVTALGGYIDAMPRRCITVGMRQILQARALRFYMNRPWQRGIVRKICLGKVCPQAPASFLQTHPDAKLIVSSDVLEPPAGQLR